LGALAVGTVRPLGFGTGVDLDGDARGVERQRLRWAAIATIEQFARCGDGGRDIRAIEDLDETLDRGEGMDAAEGADIRAG
jgi:hypothetical protein